jgi:hypothetical protein
MVHGVRRITVRPIFKIHALIYQFFRRDVNVTQLWRLYVDRFYRLAFHVVKRAYPKQDRAKERGMTSTGHHNLVIKGSPGAP